MGKWVKCRDKCLSVQLEDINHLLFFGAIFKNIFVRNLISIKLTFIAEKEQTYLHRAQNTLLA
jgi:hypothetical protein